MFRTDQLIIEKRRYLRYRFTVHTYITYIHTYIHTKMNIIMC